MNYCNHCGDVFPKKRYHLGYRTCIVCGDKQAQKAAKLKSKYVAPLYNKGAYQYIGTIDNIKDIGR